MLKNKLVVTFLASIAFLSLGLNDYSIAKENHKLIQKNAMGEVDWLNKIIKVKGSGALPDKGGVAQKRLKARLAARNDAYRNLAEMVNGVKISSETNVKNFMVTSDIIKLKVDGVIKGARQIGEEKYNSDGSVEVELALPMFGNGSVASAVDLGNYVKSKESVDALIPYHIASIENIIIKEKARKNLYNNFILVEDKPVTGLIIQAEDLAVEPAMSPFIVGGGKIIYTGSKIDIDPDKIVKFGVTDYTETLEEAQSKTERIGTSPMIIEAKGATGAPYRTNILLDDETIENLVKANKKYNFLENLGVVIVI